MNENLPLTVRLARAEMRAAQLRKRDAVAMKIVVGALLGAIVSVGIFVLEYYQGEYLSEIITDAVARLIL